MMKIGIAKEILNDNKRAAATPETVAKMKKAELEVHVQAGTGLHAHITDAEYQQAGAIIENSLETLYKNSDIILRVNLSNDSNEIDLMNENAILICPYSPMKNPDIVTKLNKRKITSFSIDMLPRLARTQSMDVLSSMSNLAGYKSIILAANYSGKIFPMMMTAAGSIQPAKVIVIGAGVAGLQAIATARRLGASVLAFDTRPPVAEQVKSLGAEFVSLETSHDQAQDKEGYAKEQSAEFYASEQQIISRYLKEADIVITTALIPNKPAPILITEAMLGQMKAGSVIVDLAVEQKGNCEISEPGKIIITKQGITVIGLLNVPDTLPVHATQLYSNNVFSFLNFILPFIKNNEFDFSDEIIKSCLITHNGKIVHQQKESKHAV